MWAVRKGELAIAKVLLARPGIDINAMTKEDYASSQMDSGTHGSR